MLADDDPRIRATAAAALADQHAAKTTSTSPKRRWPASSPTPRRRHGSARRDVAVAIRQTSLPRFRRLLIPLLYDPAPDVADEAMDSVTAAGTDDFVFVPALIALLRHRRLKGHARAVLVGYGEPVIDALAHFLRDPDEDIWVRRHIPGDAGADSLAEDGRRADGALEETDGFLRYKAVSALERLRREHADADLPAPPIETLTHRRRHATISTTCRCTTTCSAGTACRRTRRWRWRSSRSSRAPRTGSTGCWR